MIFAELSYFHLDRSARGYVSKRKATSVVAEHSKNLSYYKKLLGLPDYAKDQATVTHPVRESFFTQREKKCHNCLPNYFIRAGESDKSKYRRGTVGFLHHLKSGGTTMHSCLRKLLSRPYTWNGKTSVNQVYKEGFGFVDRVLWKNLTEKSRLAHHFVGGSSVMGLCDDFQIYETLPCSYFTVLRDPIDRAVATYFYCKVRSWDMLCATNQLKATEANISQWALHQRNFLFTQLTFDVRYCQGASKDTQRSAPCWYRQRAIMEQADLETRFQFIVKDLTDRFAVIGILDHLKESLSMLETVRVEKIHCVVLY